VRVVPPSGVPEALYECLNRSGCGKSRIGGSCSSKQPSERPPHRRRKADRGAPRIPVGETVTVTPVLAMRRQGAKNRLHPGRLRCRPSGPRTRVGLDRWSKRRFAAPGGTWTPSAISCDGRGATCARSPKATLTTHQRSGIVQRRHGEHGGVHLPPFLEQKVPNAVKALVGAVGSGMAKPCPGRWPRQARLPRSGISLRNNRQHERGTTPPHAGQAPPRVQANGSIACTTGCGGSWAGSCASAAGLCEARGSTRRQSGPLSSGRVGCVTQRRTPRRRTNCRCSARDVRRKVWQNEIGIVRTVVLHRETSLHGQADADAEHERCTGDISQHPVCSLERLDGRSGRRPMPIDRTIGITRYRQGPAPPVAMPHRRDQQDPSTIGGIGCDMVDDVAMARTADTLDRSDPAEHGEATGSSTVIR